jgi:VWFA-related protein
MLFRRAVLCSIFVLPLAPAQAPHQQQAPDTPVFRSETRDVIVDLVVTDDNGTPITGLKSADFRVLENSKPQKVDFFEEHTAKTLPPGTKAGLPAMPPNVYTNVPSAPESDAVNILLFDTLNTPEQEFAYSRQQVIQYLHNVKPGTRTAILTLGDRLNFVQGFTDDPAKLLAAVEAKKKDTDQQESPILVSRSEEAEFKATIAMRQSSVGGVSTYGVQALSRAFDRLQNFSQLNRSMMTLEALQDISRYLANLPGRKNLIWFSTEFPVFLLPNQSERGSMQDLAQPLSVVRKTADMLTTARVAVYPIEAEGLMNDSWFLADSGGPGNTPTYVGGTSTSPTMGNAAGMMTTSSLMSEASRRAAILQQMHQLADDTGGKAIYNSNDLAGAAARAIDDGSHFYTLTYSPANKKLDGSYRKIEIKGADKHWKLSWRRGYNADQPDRRAMQISSEPLHPLMLMGLPNANEILYGIRVLPAGQQPAAGALPAGKNDKLKGPFRRIGVDFFVRWSDLKFSPGPANTHKANIQVEVLAYDRNGTALNWTGGTLLMKLNPDTWATVQKSGVPAHLEIDVPRDQDVVLSTGVYDYGSSRAGTLQVDSPARQEAVAARSGAQ